MFSRSCIVSYDILNFVLKKKKNENYVFQSYWKSPLSRLNSHYEEFITEMF